MVKKRWSDLSDGQKAAVLVLGSLQVGLLAAALWDLVHRNADEVRGDRRMWAALVFINWIGPLAYFAIGRKAGMPCRTLCQKWCGTWCHPRSEEAGEPGLEDPAALI